VKISDHDLRQIDAESLHTVPNRDALERLALWLAEDLKEARERLNQTPENSSRPPSSRDPWSRKQDETEPEIAGDLPQEDAEPDKEEGKEKKEAQKEEPSKPRHPGKQEGCPGFARTQTLPITATISHIPENCFRCGADLPPEQAVCYTGYESLDVEFGDTDSPGLQITNTKHLYFETTCSCGHHNRSEPHRTPPAGGDWGAVVVCQWRLIDAGLAALLLFLHFRMRLSVRYCREFLRELFGITLSDGAISQSVHASARAMAPAAEQIRDEVQHSALAYSDETPHHQAGEFLWLWVVANAHAVFFAIGRRTKEMFLGIIGSEFAGWLMSDGYNAYRHHELRLRCWAHLIRKARALAETFTPHAQGYGIRLLAIFDRMIAAIGQAREGPPTDLRPLLAEDLKQLRELCEKMARSIHDKSAQLGRELLNDWDAIFRVLEHPQMPLSRVEVWRGDLRPGLSVSASFVWRCLTSRTLAPFPHPARRTRRADFPQRALFQGIRPSHSNGWRAAAAGVSVPTRRRGTGRGIGGTPFPACRAYPSTRSADVAPRNCRSAGRLSRPVLG
jgi:transposase